jgi:peptide/nickel transport system permease protein
VARVAEEMGLNDPVVVQYGRFLGGLMPVSFRGGPHLKEPSLGRSYATRQPVTAIVKDAAPVTASLVFGGAILWILVALPIGILSALRPRSLLDRSAMVFVLIGISAHPVWIGLILIYFIGYRVGLTPLGGYCDMVNPSTDCGGPIQWAHSLVLPWITFAILFAALYVRMIRANVLEAMNEDYVRTARAKGQIERKVVLRHVFRNALLPVVTISGLALGGLLGGSVAVERAFGVPGLGQALVFALNERDWMIIQNLVLLYGVIFVFVNLAIDISYGLLNPTVRYDE